MSALTPLRREPLWIERLRIVPQKPVPMDHPRDDSDLCSLRYFDACDFIVFKNSTVRETWCRWIKAHGLFEHHLSVGKIGEIVVSRRASVEHLLKFRM